MLVSVGNFHYAVKTLGWWALWVSETFREGTSFI